MAPIALEIAALSVLYVALFCVVISVIGETVCKIMRTHHLAKYEAMHSLPPVEREAVRLP